MYRTKQNQRNCGSQMFFPSGLSLKSKSRGIGLHLTYQVLDTDDRQTYSINVSRTKKISPECSRQQAIECPVAKRSIDVLTTDLTGDEPYRTTL
ncbi:hypothetical protein STEG23_015173, partial [Scotinomys teguina]